MASLEFTPIVPTIAGTAFATTAVVDGSDTYLYIPISSALRTVVVIKNTHSTDTKTVTFTSQADEWGNTGASLNKVITVPALTTVITGVWLRNRWAEETDPGYNFGAALACEVAYQTAANIEIAVLNVPNASKD
jgi:hypothetical protein